MNSDSSVDIATYYELDEQGSIPDRGKSFFLLLYSVQNGYGTQPASYPVCTGGYFPRSKMAGAWVLALTSM
jgi:hypothetical protein